MSVTINGTSGLVFADGSSQASGGYTGFRNRIINGDMKIDQRNAGAGVAVTDAYTLDRWEVREDTDGAITVQQVADAPTGFSYSAKITTTTADASLTTIQRLFIGQYIEGFNTADLSFGTASASSVTLSFWVKSSLTGTFAGALQNSARDRSYVFNYTINSANTWEQKSVTVAGDTTGTWIGATNGIGLRAVFSLGIGPTYTGTANSWQATTLYASSGAVSVIGTLNATWQVTGVQLEKGSTATPFEVRSYGTELALCQRYYEKTYDIGTVPGTASSSGGNGYTINGIGSGTNDRNFPLLGGKYAIEKRSVPTMTFYSPSSGTANRISGYSSGTDYTVTSYASAGTKGFGYIVTSSSPPTTEASAFHFVASAEL